MDVNNLNPNNLAERRLREAEAAPARDGSERTDRAAATQPQDGGSDDQVRLSATARQLQDLGAKVRDQDTFDHERVERIRAAIAEGRYPIDTQRLADQMLKLESELDQ